LSDYSDIHEKETDKIRMLELVSQLAENESERTWKRFSILLAMNGALVALVSLAPPENLRFSSIIGSLLGLLLTFVWYRMIPISKYYEKRWHADMLAIISSSPHIAKYIKGRDSLTARVERPSNRSASSYSKILVLGIGAMWFLNLIAGIILLYSSTWQIKPS